MAVIKEDVSLEHTRRVLFVLLLMVIFVTLIGTWSILSYLDTLQQQKIVTRVIMVQGPPPPPTSGFVGLEVLPPKKPTQQQEKQEKK